AGTGGRVRKVRERKLAVALEHHASHVVLSWKIVAADRMPVLLFSRPIPQSPICEKAARNGIACTRDLPHDPHRGRRRPDKPTAMELRSCPINLCRIEVSGCGAAVSAIACWCCCTGWRQRRGV